MIQAIIWDLGEVLCGDVWENMYRDKNQGVRSICTLPSDQELREGGRALWEEFAYRDATEAEYWIAFNQRFGQHHAPTVYIELSDRFIRPVPGMLPLVEQLHARGVPMTICSNNTAFWYAKQWQTLRLDRFFSDDRAIVSFREGVPKSHPSLRMFRRAAKVLGVATGECLFIDDRLGNVQRALESGMTGIQMPTDHTVALQYLTALFTAMGWL